MSYTPLGTTAWMQEVEQCREQRRCAGGTGVDHEQAALALADSGVRVSIVNPAQVRDFGRSLGIRPKNDGMDRVVLARYGALLKPRAWTPPAPEARVLQALLARREAVAQDWQRECKRLEKADATDTPPLIHQSLSDSIGFLERPLAKLDRAIDDPINHQPHVKTDRDWLLSLPAVGPRVGNPLVSVRHNRTFENAEQLAAYRGRVPVERQSGSSACPSSFIESGASKGSRGVV